MKRADLIKNKILTRTEAVHKIAQLKYLGKKIVFTNGVFDIIHEGHIYSLSMAAAAGDFLIIGLNADASVKRLKGESRPINTENSRALILASLVMVDAVILFEEDTPLELIKALLPDVLVKGGDYTTEQVAGAAEVIAAGGRVLINPILDGFSTSSTINRMKNS